MFKKILIKLAAVGAICAAAYVGGSYYVGIRAEQALMAVMNDAQARANNQLLWENVNIKQGVFTSTGSMELVLTQVKLDTGEPARARIDYTIHHHLHWARVAHFVWSATPDALLAKQMEPFYPQVPSVSGDGTVDWSGLATSSIAFPGINNEASEGGTLTVAPLAGQMTAGNNAFDIKLGTSEVTLLDSGGPSRLQLKNLAYEARSSDVASGSASVSLLMQDALLIDENGLSNTLSGYRWHFDVVYQDDILRLDTQKTIASLTVQGNQASNVVIDVGIDGLHRSDLQAFAMLVDEVDGQWLAMSEQQSARVQQLALSMLARGFVLRVPAIRADIKLMGEQPAQTVSLENFNLTVQVTDPKLAIGKLGFALDSLKVPEPFVSHVPEITGLKFDIANEVVDGRVALTAKKTLRELAQDGQRVRDVDVDIRLSGFTPEGLVELIDMASDLGGDFSQLSEAQQAKLTQIMQDAASQELVLTIPTLKGTVDMGLGQSDSLLLEGLDLQVKLDDADTGAGTASLLLQSLGASGPQMEGIPSIKNYRIKVNNQVVDGKADYQVDKSIEAFENAMVKLGPSEVSMRLTGLSAVDLQRFSELMPALEAGLDQAQKAELAQIARRAIATGFVLSIPKLQIAIDAAKVSGQGQVSLAGLGSAPLVSFDVGRLAQMQAQIDLAGQSPWLDMLVQQGLAMGLLASDGDSAKGQYQFKDGQLLLNGVAVPTGEFVLVANLMVQQMLAQAAAKDELLDPKLPRQRRGRGGD